MKVYFETTGCRLNQSEVEALAAQFQQAGHAVVTAAEEADLCVVNTCAVTNGATRTSRTMIRRINRANADARIVVTGCYAHLSPETVGALPGVTQVVNNIDKDRLVPLVLDTAPEEVFDREPLAREWGGGALGRTRAFVKVQDGCNNRCTFCVTTIARGPGRSRAQDEIVREIDGLAAAGFQEAVLTGVHLGSYGHDGGDHEGLHTLVESILRHTSIPRLRLSSLEPWDLSPRFFELWAEPRLCRHLHLPLQSGCDATLKRMARRTTRASFRALVTAARAQIPDLAISTDVIVGFPGETDAEFEASLDFVRELAFTKLHVFRYSRRPGTAAARMPGHVDADAKKTRSTQMLAASEEGARQFARRFVGREVSVLWEHVAGASEAGFRNTGLTDHYVRVDLDAPEVLTNTISRVCATELIEHGLRGEIALHACVE
ncbi:tRNA (N(6)-L-threonylcarbamoyladenosine(37)-C(2))-methylthiotransferase MtaB [Aggregatilinea lenta]|uniref:tRNA (N(6)-L-threonylcarbamoyladenosine(37)-C(2))- methylthiotransferase MtaB n=1 Tax=Aggregatilinea lenta TaxID=913108 RepID=UPI000E5AEAF8|nr:tRNA (N(6)-L-threonylcarbamoyladenosine(37)-C(2))-methylthiotransferase MtaB [Aggregatilinea lenta]